MRYLRRKQGVMAVVVALLLVPAAAAGDAAGWVNAADAKPLVPMANGLGRGFFGIGLEDLGASGQLPEVDQLSDELLRLAGDPNALATTGDPILVPNGPLGIPGPARQAYDKAAALLATQMPSCHLPWYLLASIGRIESNHGNGGQVNAKGDTLTRILGPVLNGAGFAAVADTDHGVYDGDTQWDRAIGPMQFIPATWEQYASDGNGDGVKNPHNFYDAATAAGKYLCSGGLDLSNPQQRGIAVFRYNHSESYVRTVLIWAEAYANGATEIPAGTGVTTYPDPQAVAQQPYQPPIEITPTPTPTPTPSASPPPPTDTSVVIPGGPSDPPPSDPPPSDPPPSDPPPSDPPPSDPPPSDPPVCPPTSSSTLPSSAPPGSSSSGGAATSTPPPSGSSAANAAAADPGTPSCTPATK
jgi:hypothetical protein